MDPAFRSLPRPVSPLALGPAQLPLAHTLPTQLRVLSYIFRLSLSSQRPRSVSGRVAFHCGPSSSSPAHHLASQISLQLPPPGPSRPLPQSRLSLTARAEGRRVGLPQQLGAGRPAKEARPTGRCVALVTAGFHDTVSRQASYSGAAQTGSTGGTCRWKLSPVLSPDLLIRHRSPSPPVTVCVHGSWRRVVKRTPDKHSGGQLFSPSHVLETHCPSRCSGHIAELAAPSTAGAG